MENGFVCLPREAHWLAEYLHELTTFPNGKHDDQVDSTSQALGWAKQRKSGWGILEYYRQLAEQSHKERSNVMIRLKVPPGASHIYTITGRAILVPADRTIEVNEYEGKPLLALGYDRL